MALTTLKNDKRITGNLVVDGTITANAGITGTGPMVPAATVPTVAAHYSSWVSTEGGVIKTSILIDIQGLNEGGTAGDIIGPNGVAAHIGQVTAAVNGTIYAGRMTCLETPTGGTVDIDLYMATAGTGAEDAAVSGLAGQAQLINAGNSSAGSADDFTAWPSADAYLYLVGQGTGNTAYTAGRFLIEMWGHRL